MNEGKELIEFTKEIIKNSAELDDIIDKAIESLKDYTDTLGDIITPLKYLMSMYNLKKRMTFKSFVINYSKQINNQYQIDEKETEKLLSFFKSKKNVIYISDIIDSAVNAKSLKSTALLGAIAGNFIKDKENITYECLSIIDSLKIMNDFDLENFISLCEYLKTTETAHEATSEYRTTDFYNIENTNQPTVEQKSLELTIEKLKQTNGLTYNSGGIGQAGNSKGSFETNEITNRLYKLIIDTKIIE